MKKIFLPIICLLLMGNVSAKPVDAITARRVADTYLRDRGMRNTAALVDVTAQTPFTEFYVFAAPEGGFILVSGDDCVTPVLGYSVTNRFETKDIPEHVMAWLQGYEDGIKRVKESTIQSVSQEWNLLEAGEIPEPLLETAVAPMLTTTWDQSPYYNELCPYHDSTAARSVTGCVATATAQVMKYYNHPTTGYGSHTYTSERTKNGIHYVFPDLTANFGATTYQWSNMPNALTGASSATEVNAVATLMYHIGVGVEMDYSPAASGANNYNTRGVIKSSSQTALMYYFKYRADMSPLARADYSDAVYCAMLRAELDQNRPVLYSGSHTSGAHSFVFDGYDDNGRFHVNWGWGGSSNGYFVMGSLNPGTGGIGGNSSGTYNMSNVALIGIQPHTGWNTVGTTTVNVVSNGNGTVSGSGSYAFGDTVTMMATAAAGYRFSGWSDGSKFNPREIIANGGSYTFTATFEAVSGDTLHFCPGNKCLTSYGFGSNGGNNYWGIHLPASVLNPDSSLKAVQFFVVEPGTYDLTVYTGVNHSNIAARDTVTYGSSEEETWQTITLTNPVPATSDIWIVLHNYGTGYPQSATYYSGADGSFISGSGFDDKGASRQLSAMVKGIFCSCVTPVDHSCDITTFPFVEDFDDGLVPCWETYNANGGNSMWRFCESTYGYNNTQCMGIKYANNSDDWLMLPPMAVAGDYSLAWKARIRSTSYSETYQVLWYDGSDTTMLFQETLSSTTYQDRTATFTVPVGSSGRIVFRYVSDDKYYLYLDNIVINQLAIPPQYVVTVEPNNAEWGTVSGGGTYPEGATVTLSATANSGYRFVQWQDSVVQNPRTVTVTDDTAFTAVFEPIPQYTVTINSIFHDGSTDSYVQTLVAGAGTYYDGETVTLEGAVQGCATSLDYWVIETGDTILDNPYTFVIHSDRTVTAVFGDYGGIGDVLAQSIKLYPNPASTTLSVTVEEPGRASVMDNNGRILWQQQLAAGVNTIDVSLLPAGVYYVKIGTRHSSFIIQR